MAGDLPQFGNADGKKAAGRDFTRPGRCCFAAAATDVPEAEITRALRADALGAAEVAAPPKGTPFDAPDAGSGYGTPNVQKHVLGKVRGARPIALENRASNTFPNDQRRKTL